MAHSREAVAAVAAVRVVAAQVLLLNASHEPLAVVTWRRAVVLILAGKAVSLEDRADLVHSAQRAVALPSVVSTLR